MRSATVVVNARIDLASGPPLIVTACTGVITLLQLDDLPDAVVGEDRQPKGRFANTRTNVSPTELAPARRRAEKRLRCGAADAIPVASATQDNTKMGKTRVVDRKPAAVYPNFIKKTIV